MKTILFVCLLYGVTYLPAQAQGDSVANNRPIFTVVEQHPEFPGGIRKLGRYLEENLQYPEAARNAKLEGRVFVNFIVNDDGRITHVKALNKLGLGTDEEAIRLVASMPNWIPGKQNGRPVNVFYNLPINFKLK
ncbi:energy transducer TonB [Spirosoma sp. KNUC1025]|uniref:energy transducer TonB n=1 Tax=Spirosoma sp. KNUC1025 TaxID=2894082 RepID=UPI0038689A41|nr:energy transducer TonB [Spirosoma sp. KNUC1025]